MQIMRMPFWVRCFAAEEQGGGETPPPENDGVEEEVSEEAAEDGDLAEDDEAEDTEGVEALGDAGKKALDRMKAKYKAERAKRQELEAKLNPPEKGEADAMSRADQKILRALHNSGCIVKSLQTHAQWEESEVL